MVSQAADQAAANEAALARIRDLCPLVREHAAKVEATGTLTNTVIAALRETQAFWITVPTDLGGGGADILTGLQCGKR
jgi:alkylation response protein AidB-like acyl-CoA dehydrogenase